MINNNPIKIAISGGDSWVNTGDEAILTGTLQLFESLESNLSINIVSGNKKKTQKQFPKYEVINRKNPIEYFRKVRDIDFFIWGGGHILQNTSSKLFLAFQFYLILIPLLLNKKIIGFCLGAEIIHGNLWNWLTKQILNKFELISVRDKFSLSIINDLGLDIPVILSADPAVMLNPESPTTMTNIIFPQSPYIILSIRKWFDYRSSLLPIKYLRKFELNENKRFLKSLDVFRKMCDWIIENYGFHIYFIPMYIENEQNDNDVAKRIKNGMAHANLAHVIDDQMPPRTLIRFMENAEFLIGMRMHSTILGACAGIPIIGLYYQHKGKCFFQSMGIENLMLSIEDVNQNDLSDMIDHVLTNKSSIVRKTTNNLSNQKSLVQTTVNRIGRQFFQSPHA